jgi:hypothetical protein
MAFASGQLSFYKVRALTRIADGVNEAELLKLAHHATAAQTENWCAPTAGSVASPNVNRPWPVMLCAN